MPLSWRSLVLASLFLSAEVVSARRTVGASGMSADMMWENPEMWDEEARLVDPVISDICLKTPKWAADPVLPPDDPAAAALLPPRLLRAPLHLTLFQKGLPSGKRSGWMRAKAHLGDPDAAGRWSSAVPVRAVWTLRHLDETNRSTKAGSTVGRDPLQDSYEDCLFRRNGKLVEIEVLLPRGKRGKGAPRPGLAPPSLVYQVPIIGGVVNPLGMVAQGRATVALYPRGRSLSATAAGGGRGGPRAARKAQPDAPPDEAIPLGMVDFHLPIGSGLVDPGWAKGKRVFWKGRSVGVI